MLKDDTTDGYEFSGDVSAELVVGIYGDWMLRFGGSFSENDRTETGACSALGTTLRLARRFWHGVGRRMRRVPPHPRRFGRP